MIPAAPGGITRISFPFSAAYCSRICWSLVPACCIARILVLFIWHTGQRPSGGMRHAMFSLQPQLQLSFAATRFTAGDSSSVAVCASAAMVIKTTSKLVLNFGMVPRDRHHFRSRPDQTGLARNQADDGAE